MGLFGNKDAAEVPNDPFYVAPDTYYCVLTEANRVTKKDGSGEGLAFKWTIQDADSEFNGQTLNDWKNIYPDLDEADETPDVRKDNARLKQRLLEMGVSEDEMNELLDNLEELVGREAYVTVKESVDKHDPDKKYTNVTKVRIDD